jgi:hypothetical protein
MSHMSGATPQRVTLTVTVEIDPVAYGFDLPAYEAGELVLRAINATPGLEVGDDPAVEHAGPSKREIASWAASNDDYVKQGRR